MISVSEATRIIRAHAAPLAGEALALAEAPGRILAEDIVADTDLPPFDRSQMDGYAVRAVDVQDVPVRLRIAGESAAGRGWHQEMQPGEAVRIMTGAPVPAGADSVQQVELTNEFAASDGTRAVEILKAVPAGRSIVLRGSEIRAGETVLTAGERIGPAALAVLASFGYAQVRVGRQPRVAVLATGSELVSVEQKPGPDQIRDSNSISLAAYAVLAGAAVELLPLAGDDPGLLKDQIMAAAERSDLVITSGGVSVGAYDFTKPALRELGAEIFFERVALRPGKPTVFARLQDGTLFFGLPGNPVSVAVTFNLFTRTALLELQGAKQATLSADWARLGSSVKGAAERESYLPALLGTDADGLLVAQPLKWGGSSDFVGFVRATSLVIVPADTGKMEAGSKVRVVHLPG